MSVPLSHVAPQLCLVIGACVALVYALFAPRRAQGGGALIAVATAVVASASAGILWTGRQQITFGQTWALDGSQLWATQIILGIVVAVVGLTPEWLRRDPRHGEYYAVLLLSAVGASLLAGSADTMELVVGMLLASITGYALAAYHRASALSVEAGIKYFLVGSLANIFLILGVVLLYGITGSTAYDVIHAALIPGEISAVALVAAVGFVVVGLTLELGAFPAYAWMPDVAQGAPAPSAAFLTVAPKVGALIALGRFLTLLPPDVVAWRSLAAVVAVITMTLGNLAAFWQEDVRRLLGWSAVSQSGYVLVALVGLDRSDLAIPALLYFLAAYALANLAAFSVVTELRGRTALDGYAGLSRERPWLAAALAVSLLSLVGIPPLAGFAGKLAIFATAIDAGYGWLAAIAVANTVASLFYYLRVLGPVYMAEPAGAVPILGRWAGVVVGATTVGVVVIGVTAEPLLDTFANALLLP